MSTYLDRILEAHRARADEDDRPLDRLVDAALESGRSDPVRDFRGALAASAGVAVIAEVKRRSPSRGELAPDVDAAAVALEYEAGGATCLSVLTDEEFFGGSPADLSAARAATSLPVLRKDFTVGEADVCDARLMGADAVLLIVAALADEELSRLLSLAGELAMSALVEVHDEAELERALAAGASTVGVNQRDLWTFEVDRERAERLARVMPGGVVRVAESGVSSADDVARLGRAGYDAVLVGESLVVAPDRSEAVRAMVRAGQPASRAAG